jgi:hypothetical protein
MLQVNKNTGFARFYFTVSRPAAEQHLDGARTAEKPYWQHEHGTEKPENTVNSNSHDAERQRQQPDDWIQHQSQQRNGPAQNEKNDPQEESSHGNLVCGGC